MERLQEWAANQSIGYRPQHFYSRTDPLFSSSKNKRLGELCEFYNATGSLKETSFCSQTIKVLKTFVVYIGLSKHIINHLINPINFLVQDVHTDRCYQKQVANDQQPFQQGHHEKYTGLCLSYRFNTGVSNFIFEYIKYPCYQWSQ